MTISRFGKRTGAARDHGRSRSLFGSLALLAALAANGCSILYTRPVQDMSDTQAAIRAAREVQADTLAPELYRQAGEWFFRARHEYKFKNFKLATEYAEKARSFAEAAEFEAIRNGGSRGGEGGVSDQTAPAPTSAPYDYPTPTGTPADVYEQRKAEEDKARQQQSQQQSKPNPSPNSPPGATPGH